MSKAKLKVLLVDDEFKPEAGGHKLTDEQRELNELIHLLEVTELVSVTPHTHYDELGATPVEVCQTVSRYDLLILDVYMSAGRDSQPFIKTLNAIGRVRPFLAYTVLKASEDLDKDRDVSLRDLVYRMGGLGILTKPATENETGRHTVYYEVVDRVLWYYWCTHSVRADSNNACPA